MDFLFRYGKKFRFREMNRQYETRNKNRLCTGCERKITSWLFTMLHSRVGLRNATIRKKTSNKHQQASSSRRTLLREDVLEWGRERESRDEASLEKNESPGSLCLAARSAVTAMHSIGCSRLTEARAYLFQPESSHSA